MNYYKVLCALFMGMSVSAGFWRYLCRYKMNTEEIKELLKFIRRLKNEVMQYFPLPEAIQRAAENTEYEKNAELLLKSMNEKPASDLYGLWNQMWESAMVPAEERKILKELMVNLNIKDHSMQKQILDSTIQSMERKMAEREQKWMEQKKLYIKLSTLIGVLVMIVLL